MCEVLAADGYGLIPVADVHVEHLEKFACGAENLDEFLRSSRGAHDQRLSHTTLVMHRDFDGRPVGYFTLSNDSIKLKTSEISELGLDEFGTLVSFPAVKLGRFAVDKSLHGTGVGSQILRFVDGSILDSDYRSAARLIVVDAVNKPEVIKFYRRNGYELSLWAEDLQKNHGGNARGKNTKPQTVKMIKDVFAK